MAASLNVLALGRKNAAAFASIASGLSALGKIAYRAEASFRHPDDCLEFIRSRAFDVVVMPNPYGNLLRLDIYRLLRQERFPVIAFDRGGLPRSWFFDVGFNADSTSYRADAWDRPLDPEVRTRVHDYIRQVRTELAPLEAQGERIGVERCRERLGIGDRKVLLVPLQRPTDTTVRYFSAPMRDLGNFEDLVRATSELMRERLTDWVVVAKKHPLEEVSPSLPVVQAAADTHINDLIELADAVLLLNSGTGLLGLCWDKPVLIAGTAYYADPRLNRQVATVDDVEDALLRPRPVDQETRDRFIHHLISTVYSFGTFHTELVKEANGAWRNVTRRIDFETVRFPSIRKRVSILYVTSVIPWPIDRGAAHRTDQVLRALLEQDIAVDLLCLNQSEPDTANAGLAARLRARYPTLRHIMVHRHPKLARLSQWPDVLVALRYQLAHLADGIGGRAHTINCAAHCPPDFAQAVKVRLFEVGYSAVWFNYLRVMPREFATDANVICDLHDYQSERIESDVLPTLRPAQREHFLRRFRESEARALARCHLALAISPIEMQRIVDELAPRGRIECVPASDDAHAPPDAGASHDLLFVGSRSDANIAGLKWFWEQCWPLIIAARSDVRLRIHGAVGGMSYGQQIASETGSRGRVVFTAPVESMDEVYASARVVVCPIRHGTGMKIKVIEAMAYGKAIVATSKAAEGIALDLGLEVFDTPEAFADACLHLLNDADARAESQRCAEATFARDHAHARLREKLARLLEELSIR